MSKRLSIILSGEDDASAVLILTDTEAEVLYKIIAEFKDSMTVTGRYIPKLVVVDIDDQEKKRQAMQEDYDREYAKNMQRTLGHDRKTMTAMEAAFNRAASKQ